jgi:hypothetical protein
MSPSEDSPNTRGMRQEGGNGNDQSILNVELISLEISSPVKKGRVVEKEENEPIGGGN